MKLLLKIVLRNKMHLGKFILLMVAMFSLTISSQLEICSLGVMASKGPDFFELFSPIVNGKLQRSDEISWASVESRYKEIDRDGNGVISNTDTHKFLVRNQSENFFHKIVSYVNDRFDISNNITNFAMLLFCVAIYKALSMFYYRYCIGTIAVSVSQNLREQYFQHIQRLPMKFYHEYNIGSITARVSSDSITIAQALTSSMINFVQLPFTLATTLALCFFTSWRLSLVIFFGLPLILVPVIFLARKIKAASRELQKSQESFATVLIDYLAGVQTVKVFSMENYSLNKYREHNNRMAKLQNRIIRYDQATRPILHTLAMVFLVTVLFTGVYVLGMGVAELFWYAGLLWLFYEPVKKFAEENNNIQKGVAAAERLYEVLNIQPEIEDIPNAKVLTDFKESLEFDNVSFRYGDEWVLNDISFTINKGETVAFVGPTGAGKSTVVQLIPRLYDVTKGEIRIDGHPLRNYTQASIREQVSFVPQKPFLFLDTIRENIVHGNEFSDEEVQTAAKQALAHEFISDMPNAYESILEESGKNLSGGQQQRVAIARALVKGSPILILDEATSALDNLSERGVKQAIEKLKGSMTQLIIAHRLSTIEGADRIIYFDKGRILDQGTKDELLERCLPFKEMWEARVSTEPTCV
jgi:ABC-type multidrug transport system fused ATPase/permease subunit